MTGELKRILRDIGPVDATAAQERFVRRAIDDGLVDVAYAPVDSPLGELVSAVTPRGLVRLAYEDGRGAAVLAAGNALGANPMPIVVPCHRIVRTGGKLGGYTGGVQRKEFLLTLEGTLPR